MPPTVPAALLTELGTSRGDWASTPLGGTDPYETTKELVWPLNVAVYDHMGRSDGQCIAVEQSATLPILGARATIPRTAGVREVVRATVEAELGLTLDDQGRRRSRKGGVSWDETLRHACLKLRYGHMPLEQVYELGPAEFQGGPPTVYHLKKLAPRMPRTLASIDVAGDGGLDGVHQWVTENHVMRSVPIPVDKLVMFANQREGADWAGRSIFRGAYKNWMLKDVFLRLGAITVDRNGMGLPVVFYPTDAGAGGDNSANKAKALKIAKEVRAGDDTGVALPQDWELKLVGVEGSTVDGLPWVNYHDQAIGRSALQMFLNLGHDNGARSLGDTFLDWFMLAEMAFARGLEEEFTEHVIRDFVRLNFGDNEPYPPLVFEEVDATSPAMLTAIAGLAKNGLIEPSQAAIATVHRWARLPAPDGRPPTAPAAEGGPSDDPVVRPLPDAPAGGGAPPLAGPVGIPTGERPAVAAAAAGPTPDEMLDRAGELVAVIAALKAAGGA